MKAPPPARQSPSNNTVSKKKEINTKQKTSSQTGRTSVNRKKKRLSSYLAVTWIILSSVPVVPFDFNKRNQVNYGCKNVCCIKFHKTRIGFFFQVQPSGSERLTTQFSRELFIAFFRGVVTETNWLFQCRGRKLSAAQQSAFDRRKRSQSIKGRPEKSITASATGSDQSKTTTALNSTTGWESPWK